MIKTNAPNRNAIRPWLLLIVSFHTLGIITTRAVGQSTPTESESPSSCSQDNALDTIRSQIDASKLIDDAPRRIIVLIRSADLLWTFQQDVARAAFAQAFEVAQQDEKKRREKAFESRSLIQAMQSPDQRYVVIRAITKRDPAWAKKLSAQAIELDRAKPEHAAPGDSFHELLIGQKLLDAATQLISTDSNAAMDLARSSLRFPATFMLARFLYKFAGINQAAADKFYDEALSVYSYRPMREFLYMATYPFGLQTSGDTPVFGFYAVPEGFVTNKPLQRRFALMLIRRAEQSLVDPLDEGDNFNGLSGPAHLLQVLVRIEPHVRRNLPDLIEQLVAAREKILVSLPLETQKIFTTQTNDGSSSRAKTFAERIEEAEKISNSNAREDWIVDTVMSSSEREKLPDVLRAVDKISDSNIRQLLLDWLYFTRAQNLTRQHQFGEAETFARKIEGHEEKAFVYLQLVKEMMKPTETQTHARELLDEAISEANKAGSTIFAARILLTASNIYANLDLNRSLATLADAVKVINSLDSPDFTADNHMRIKEIRRKTTGRFVLRFYMPGLDAENAFRELAKIDFNDTFSQTASLTDKFQRAMTTLAVADVCVQKANRRGLQKVKRPAGQ